MQSLSLKVWSCAQACRMADISACAVGSLLAVTRLTPVAMTSPLRAMTAPKGPPPLRMFCSDSWMASCMSCWSVIALMFFKLLVVTLKMVGYCVWL